MGRISSADSPPQVICLAAGLYHTVAVTADRRVTHNCCLQPNHWIQVYSWGANSEYNYGEDYTDGVLLGYSTSTRAVEMHASQSEKVLWTAPAALTVPTLVSVLERQRIRQVNLTRDAVRVGLKQIW